MKYHKLGSTNLCVSALGLGCMNFTREKSQKSKETIWRAIECGISFFDTADVYNYGESESLIGEALQEASIPREDVVIASKCGIVFPGMKSEYQYKAYDLSPKYIKDSCENSLKRLDSEYIDLYQPHRIDYLSHPEETARALEDLMSEGKIRYVGVSNYTVDEIRALNLHIRLDSLQAQFSLLHIEPLETGLLNICLENHLTLLCWAPLHEGVLADGKKLPHDNWQLQREVGIITQLQTFAHEYGVDVGQIALAWLMQLPGSVIPLVGTTNPDHLNRAVEATNLCLERDDWYELLVIARGNPIPWEQRPYIFIRER